MSIPLCNVGDITVYEGPPEFDWMERGSLYQALMEQVSDIREAARKIAVEVAERTVGFPVKSISVTWYEHPNSQVVYGAWVVFDTKQTRDAFEESIGLRPSEEEIARQILERYGQAGGQ